MQKLTKIFRITGIIILSLFVGFVVYANWEEPPLSDRLNLKPISLAVFNLNRELSEHDSLNIANKLSTNTGITAATVNRMGRTVSVTFHGDETSEEALNKAITSEGFSPMKVDFTAFKGPQCPVPTEYIDFILNAKKALCFR
ncbi:MULTISPECIES: hypothetical protein [unclassified Arcicella]|uniref:heavy-metal-associated domain-containing protein n=1 Tax=unclassified Arcicella TaxID=2644986 RepID=UPI002861B31C|nr:MULTISPECIES: hypothetical protein [unclassified Arcicella]MDR6561193.1 copper chaperone CopZ [Arcicella sp. BE51]MDR6811077.1 copper chaperone CopZ [Arcicella sp. BE140]MDR6822427.1 copper chaperone CopZ [Arcicella sp. BE139]